MSDDGTVELTRWGEGESDDDASVDLERLTSLSGAIEEGVDAVKRALVAGDDDDLLATAGDLWRVLDELLDVLGTLDLEELPDAVHVEELPDAVEVENVPEGLTEEDEPVIDLSAVREAVELRDLWRAVDLTELREEKRELQDALEEATGDGGDDGDGLLDAELLDDDLVDDDADGGFTDVVDAGEGAHVQFDAGARQAYLEEEILDAVESFREVLLSTHEKLRRLYHANREKLGQSGHQPDSLNPTATRTMPAGPVPDSASTRSSTVPSQVRYSRVENPERIYGRRFLRRTDVPGSGRPSTTGGEGAEPSGSGEGGGVAAEDDPGAEDDPDATEEADTPEIGVYDGGDHN